MVFAYAGALRVEHFRHRVLLPVACATLGSILLAGFGLYWATTRSDAISAGRQLREVSHAVEHSINALAKEQEIVAVWDDPVLQLRKDQPDWDWMDVNIGVWLHDLYGHDQIYILDADNKPVYATVDGKRAPPESFALIELATQHLVDSIRQPHEDEISPHGRLPGRALPSNSTVLTSDRAVHATHLISVRGQPAAASVMQIIPYTAEIERTPGTEPLLVSLRFLDDDFLQQLSEFNLITSPRFSTSPALQDGEHSILLSDEHGHQIGYFTWRPELPGSALMSVLLPITLLAMGGIVLMMGFLTRGLYQAMSNQQKALLELEASEAQAQHLAFHDVLTGLPNRALFNERLDQALARARRGEELAVLLLDLDRFKHVNDTLGHQAGDALIKEFGARLTRLVGEHDTVARLSGDEFALIHQQTSSSDDLQALCRRALRLVREPFNVLGSQCHVGVSIGATTSSLAGTDRHELLRKADIALYRAKDEGRNRFCLFTADMDETVKTRQALEEELRRALLSGTAFRIHYQPQVAGKNQEVVGLEALLRWEHPTRGLIAPAQFIPLAEETGLICPLGEWVLKEASAASLRWPNLFMAVNLSPVQFRTPDFARSIIDIVRECGANPQMIELEVTESLLLDDGELVRGALRELRAAGFRIALDDFGTGYSSLSYLRTFQVDKIKIDRSFVQHLSQTGESAAIVNAVVTLGHAMGLTVTAEGVETEEQQWFLQTAGCDVLQGYRFSRPVPEVELQTLLEPQRTIRNRARAAA
ncbi:MAG TPA: EAL domain-containing protein [Mesorhizobium sp.]|jgi:diguanylate cyclase (GGDEF)-like protein|nr:EAL domain-containing protein [Mesorhizobium sp.]